MPRLSWNEIQNRAVEFAAKWAGETYERGESQSFWSDFLTVYGIDRRRQGAFFEYAVTKLSGQQGYVDLFWPGRLLVEQKSAGRDLTEARGQALDYLATMPDHDLPRYIVACDFSTFEVLELETGKSASFPLEDFPRRVRLFGFLIEERVRNLAEGDPVNREAAERMAALHNRLRDNRYVGRDLELLLVRIVFCLFADDALIFERGSFETFLRRRTRADGSDIGPWLVRIFQVLNTPEHLRQTTIDEDLKAFPYINGKLFEDPIRMPDFTSGMRNELLKATELNWSYVSPAIFGSMFQGVMDDDQRRNLGAHYTSEQNILRAIKPLFLDDLYAEFARVRHKPSELAKFHRKLSELNFLDPACGCGNFLVITYRELRRLEHKVVQDLFKGQRVIDVPSALRVNVDQMHGIEIEEFPSRIAETALWLTDHQMNLEASRLLGQHYVRLPLTASANIVCANALTTDWVDVIAPDKLDYILGNPPFIGQTYQSQQQKADVSTVLGDLPGYRKLDFVSAWYVKALNVMKANDAIKTALVSTNSITQGEQVGILWKYLFERGVSIRFAHRTFKWKNEASGVAAVYCVIIGFELNGRGLKRIFDYPDISGEPVEIPARTVNPYLVDAPAVFISSRRSPLVDEAPLMINGGKPVEGGHLLLSNEEKERLIANDTKVERWIRPFSMGNEFINGIQRWCLWLEDSTPHQRSQMPEVMERIAAVKKMRQESKKAATRQLADVPYLFAERRTSSSNFLAIPEVSSERRDYIPIGYLDSSVVCGNKLYFVPDATLLEFGILTSAMYMAWVSYVCGRLKGDYSHSNTIVYNNFPWPTDVTDAQRTSISSLAEEVIAARTKFPDSTLATLYDPLLMPVELSRAHRNLDRAVDRLYRKKPFETDADRVAHLLKRYQALTAS